MLTLSHLPQGVNPQGKERVYYTAHPADHAYCLEEISTDIFKNQNCVIYYNPDPAVPLPEAQQQELLGSMQLFVIPVTSRFLQEPSPALQADFRFAMEHHIPVLPLMQERGLDALFNKVCGQLQFLDKHDPDPTALPFEKKLEDYLNSVLLGDELTNKIRSAFDGYIFLSYRKKDRRYAQALMSRIHQTDAFQDMAIWYDEYLTPGEDFNHAIRDAMEKSKLFAMVVTESLLEKPNYIMDHEYKDARSLAMPILPVQMAQTDEAALSRYYPEIPQVVDGENGTQLSQALQTHLQDIARADRTDPLHIYYMGLAYLGGVDVEVDHARALTLITAAAEAGLVDAMYKLSRMYRNGDGVTADLSLCAHWLEQATECRRKEYEAWMAKYGINHIVSIFSAELYLNQCQMLAITLRQLYRPDAVKRICLQILSFCENCHFSLRNYASFAYRILGDIEREEGRLGRAQTYYQKSLEVTEAKLQASGSNEAKKELADNYIAFARLAQEWGEPPLAEQYYQKALPLLEALAQDMHTEKAYLDAADCCDALGAIRLQQEDFSPAMAYYNQGLALRQQAATDSGSEAARLALAESYDALGTAALKQKLDQLAQERFDEALSIRERLVQETRSDKAKLSLSDSYSHLDDLSSYRNDLPSCQEYRQKRVLLYEQLYQNKNGLSFNEQMILVLIYKIAASIPKLQKDYTQATEYLEKAQAICEALVQETDSIRAKQELADIYVLRSDIAKKQDALLPAMDYMEKCLLLREELLPETESAAQLDKICEMYRKLYQLCKAQGLEDRGWEYGEKLFAFEDTLAADADTPKTRLRQAKAYSKLGGYALAEKKLPLARYHFGQVLKILTPEESTVEALELLSDTCRQLAKLAEDQSNSPLAHSYLLQQLAADEKYLALCDTEAARLRLSDVCYRLGDLFWTEQDHARAAEYYRRNLQIRTPHFRYLAVSRYRLGIYAMECENYAEAVALLEACHSHLYNLNLPEFPERPPAALYPSLATACEKLEDGEAACRYRAIATAVERREGLTEAFYSLFRLFSTRGDAAAAAGEHQKAAALFSLASDIVNCLGEAFYQDNWYIFRESRLKQAHALRALGDVARAVELYRQILPNSEYSPLPRGNGMETYAAAYQQLALIAPDRAFFKDAIAIWKALCRHYPKNKECKQLLKLLRQLHRQCRFTKRKP